MFLCILFVCFSVLSMFLNFLMLFELLLVCLCMFELFLAVCVVFDTKNDIDDMFCCVVWFAVFFYYFLYVLVEFVKAGVF